MHTSWGLTIDAEDPARLAAFWADALGYVQADPPDGFETWNAWLKHTGVPKKEWNDAAYLEDPAGQGPSLSFLKVPEAKTREEPRAPGPEGGRRSPPVTEEAALQDRQGRRAADRRRGEGSLEVEEDGNLDHVIMTDPEGNEFCVV